MITRFKPGDKFEKRFSVSGKVYSGFIDLFDDRNPLHTDAGFATQRGFKDRVMHGNILNGFLSYFIGECLPTKNVIIHSQQIQYKNPVYLNDELAFEAKVSEVFESVKAVEFDFSFKNAETKTVAKGKIQIGILS
jgi:3-hydroxybutyryl-CoA dehydratase